MSEWEQGGGLSGDGDNGDELDVGSAGQDDEESGGGQLDEDEDLGE
jgi:hypothetical protein